MKKKLEVEINYESGLMIYLYIGQSMHRYMSRLIPKRLKKLFMGNYGYFEVDVMIDNFSRKQHQKVTLELFPENDTLKKQMSFSADTHISRRIKPYSTSTKITLRPINNGEYFTKHPFFYINYWDYDSIEKMKNYLSEMRFSYYLTCDNTEPKKGVIKILNR